MRHGLLGVKFDETLDLRSLFSKGGDSTCSRPPRIAVGCTATVRLGKVDHQVPVQDGLLGGMKVVIDDQDCVGRDVTVTIESLRSARGAICWHKDGHAGIVFDKPYSFEELSEWLAKRIERTAPGEAARR